MTCNSDRNSNNVSGECIDCICHGHGNLGSIQGSDSCREPARAMLSPGSATALVNSALEWLQPQVIQALTSSLPDPRADPESNPRPDPNQGRGRQGKTAAAAAPGALCSALAAVLQFLGAHIQARQVHMHA